MAHVIRHSSRGSDCPDVTPAGFCRVQPAPAPRGIRTAVARLRVGRGSRASLQTGPQTPDSPFLLRRRRRGVTPTASLDAGTCRRPASMVFGPELAYMGAVWQPRRGSRPQMWLPAPLKKRSHGTVPGQFSANLWASHGSGIASTTVKILHKILPTQKSISLICYR